MKLLHEIVKFQFIGLRYTRSRQAAVVKFVSGAGRRKIF